MQDNDIFKYLMYIYRVFTGNCGKVMGNNNTAVYQVIQLILFVLPNVGHLRKKYQR